MKDFINRNSIPDNILENRFKQREHYYSFVIQTSPFLQEYGEYLYFSESFKAVSIKTAIKYFTITSDLVSFLCKKRMIIESEFDSIALEKTTLNELKTFIKQYNAGVDDRGNSFMNQTQTINIHLSAVKKFFKWAFNNEYINSNISAKLETQKKTEDKRVITLDPDEIKSFLELIENGTTVFRGAEMSLSKKQLEWHETHKKRDKAIFLLMLYHGLRIEETYNLNINSFDFYKKEFTIYRKRDKFDTGYMRDEIVSVLQDYIESGRPATDNPALFLSAHGETVNRYSIEQIRKMLKKYMKIINPTKKFTPHKIRATLATRIIEIYNDIYTAQKLLGHESSKTTELYAKENERRKREVSLGITYENI